VTALETVKAVQQVLKDAGYYTGEIDGQFGPKSRAALNAAVIASESPPASFPAPGVHRVKASSFADPADVAAFRRCKAQGKSDAECFKVGDNGIGKWGDDTTVPVPMCALPPEDWESFGNQARGKKVLVTANKASVVCELRDTMPHKSHITNGAGIDLNEAAINALGLRPPVMVDATWEWV
jgi:hypothetical protein